MGSDKLIEMSTLTSESNKRIKEGMISIIQKSPQPSNALKTLKSFIDGEKTMTSFEYKFKCFLHDGAYGVHRAIEKYVGFAKRETSGGPSPKPPQTIVVDLPDGSNIKVPFGEISLPNMGDGANITIGYDTRHRIMHVSGLCEKQYVDNMDLIVRAAQQMVREESIYSDSAIRLDKDLQPKFIDLSNVGNVAMHLTSEAEFAIRPIKTRINFPDKCKANNIDLKFGCLLCGDYGTGKTLLAFKLAADAVKNGWTFIYLTDPRKTADLLEIATEFTNNGKGVVLFVEDIDLVIKGERNAEMNTILNLLDGGDTKNLNIISIFTTNHLEKIDPTFLRGKRVGSLIELTHLDTNTSRKFIESYLGDTLKDDCQEAAQLINDEKIVPSFLAEILERAKANMLFLEEDSICCNDIVDSIKSYKTQIDLATTKRQKDTSTTVAMNVVSSIITKAAKKGVMELQNEGDI